MAAQIVADDRRRFAGHEDGVFAETAEDLGDELLAGALDEDAVVAFRGVDAQRFDVDEADRQPGAEYAVLGDHEVVAELGSDDHHRVEPVAAVDVDGRVDGIHHQVGAGAAAEIRALALRFLRSHQREGAYFEGIVPALAVELQHGLVVEDHEQVVPETAVDRHRLADAVGQEAARRLDGGETVVERFDLDVGFGRRPLRAEDLADLERVVAEFAVDRQFGRGVVDREMVVAEAAVDQDAFQRATVVDPLDEEIVLDHRDERVRSRRIGTQQELVVVNGAVDRQTGPSHSLPVSWAITRDSLLPPWRIAK